MRLFSWFCLVVHGDVDSGSRLAKWVRTKGWQGQGGSTITPVGLTEAGFAASQIPRRMLAWLAFLQRSASTKARVCVSPAPVSTAQTGPAFGSHQMGSCEMGLG